MRKSNLSKSNISARIIKISIFAVAIGITTIIIALSSGRGLQEVIAKKIVSFSGHLVISSFENNTSQVSVNPFILNDNHINYLKGFKKINDFQNIAIKPGLLKNNNNFEGILFKGVDSNYNWELISDYLIEGNFPKINQEISNEIILSKSLSRRLNINIGDILVGYFKKNESQNIPNQRKFKIVGIFETGFPDYDESYILGDISQIRSINNWSPDQIGSIEVFLNNPNDDKEVAEILYNKLPSDIDVVTLKSKFKTVFQWIALFDLNILIIIIIMIFVGVVNISTGLLILIFERASMIGLLKALGAEDSLVKRTFMWNALFIITIGVLIGNFFGLGFYFLQKELGLIKLDPLTYFVDVAPVKLYIDEWLLLNLLVILISLLLIWFPLNIIRKVSPSETIRNT
tara:strand:- start:283 stop:1488 length:1206 start_codon:yes stop_codon:yes gene_type:complete